MTRAVGCRNKARDPGSAKEKDGCVPAAWRRKMGGRRAGPRGSLRSKQAALAYQSGFERV